MWIKKGWVWVSIGLLLIPLVYASSLLNEVKPDDLRAKSRGLYKLASMLVGCELDNKCMQMTLTEVIKTDPHPIYEDYLAKLNQNKSEIEFEQVHCNTPMVRAYRREITSCLMSMLREVDPKKGLTNEMRSKVEKTLTQCIQSKMTHAAKAGNLYAQSALMNRALYQKNEVAFEYWYNAIQRQRATVEYAAYRACQTPLEIIELTPPMKVEAP